jgi:hypothetical protein
MKTSAFKFLAILIVLGACSYSAEAQSNSGTSKSGDHIIYSVGIDGGLSSSVFKDTHKASLGGSLQADIPIATNVYVTINAAYQNFYGRNNVYGTNVSAPDIHLLPVKAGFKVFPISIIYIQGDAGAAFVLNKANAGYEKSTAFVYAPQVGFQLPISGGNNFLDIGVRYEATARFNSNTDNSKIKFWGLRIAYAFSPN